MTLQFTFVDWLSAFILTVGVELPVCWLLLRGPPVKDWRILGAATAASAMTHPLLWFVMPALFTDYWTYVVVCELGIVAVEALVLWLAVPTETVWRGLAASAAMNAASVVVGLLVNWLA